MLATELATACGCAPEPESSPLYAYRIPERGCAIHRTTPAEAVARQLRDHHLADDRTTVTVSARGQITVAYVATGRSVDAIEEAWAQWAEACGIPPRWSRRPGVGDRGRVSRGRVAYGQVDPGMPCEYRDGPPVRLVAHGWTRAITALAA